LWYNFFLEIAHIISYLVCYLATNERLTKIDQFSFSFHFS